MDDKPGRACAAVGCKVGGLIINQDNTIEHRMLNNEC